MHQAILPRSNDNQHRTYGGKTVVLLHSESGTYREWDVTVEGIRYAIIDEDGTWTLMRYLPASLEWVDVPGIDVDTFVAKHHLIFAA